MSYETKFKKLAKKIPSSELSLAVRSSVLSQPCMIRSFSTEAIKKGDAVDTDSKRASVLASSAIAEILFSESIDLRVSECEEIIEGLRSEQDKFKYKAGRLGLKLLSGVLHAATCIVFLDPILGPAYHALAESHANNLSDIGKAIKDEYQSLPWVYWAFVLASIALVIFFHTVVEHKLRDILFGDMAFRAEVIINALVVLPRLNSAKEAGQEVGVKTLEALKKASGHQHSNLDINGTAKLVDKFLMATDFVLNGIASGERIPPEKTVATTK